MKCDTCLESRCVVSENGFHHICCLSEDASLDCLLGRDDHYVRNPMKASEEDQHG